jgi:hypothetical protein
MKGYPQIVMCLQRYELIAPKSVCEVADKNTIAIELTIRKCARPVKNATLGEKIAVGKRRCREIVCKGKIYERRIDNSPIFEYTAYQQGPTRRKTDKATYAPC